MGEMFLLALSKKRDSFFFCGILGLLILSLFLPVEAALVAQKIKKADAAVLPKEEKPQIKNVIFMLADGTSFSALSVTRWYKTALSGQNRRQDLALDKYMCGMVQTYCSNAPIGDSAPTMSAYMTGVNAPVGFLSSAPPSEPQNDLEEVEVAWAYRPLATLAEVVRWEMGKKVGIVATSEFTHATPAAVASHALSRSQRAFIAKQMEHNGVSVLLSGGSSFLTGQMPPPSWTLYTPKDMPYLIDRKEGDGLPSLAQMTEQALGRLNEHPEGFFLMVEGSKIDWAAHSNDTVALVHEILDFDAATQVALAYAEGREDTLVIMLADHATGGPTLGNKKTSSSYAKIPLSVWFKELLLMKKSAEGLAQEILAQQDRSPEALRSLVSQYWNRELSGEWENKLWEAWVKSQKKSSASPLKGVLIDFANSFLPVAYTTRGHTGESVFLSVYHPQNKVPRGMQDAKNIADYLASQLGVKGGVQGLRAWTEKKYAPHTEVLVGWECSWEESEPAHQVLRAQKGDKELVLYAQTNKGRYGGKEFEIDSLFIYEQKTQKWYLPQDILLFCEKNQNRSK